MEITDDHITTGTMDHHGLVVAACQDLNISEKINARIGKSDQRRIVSTGKAVVAMILNGLGFTNRRLYLTHQFFATNGHSKDHRPDLKQVGLSLVVNGPSAIPVFMKRSRKLMNSRAKSM